MTELHELYNEWDGRTVVGEGSVAEPRLKFVVMDGWKINAAKQRRKKNVTWRKGETKNKKGKYKKLKEV